jgi:hypothetical protein
MSSRDIWSVASEEGIAESVGWCRCRRRRRTVSLAEEDEDGVVGGGERGRRGRCRWRRRRGRTRTVSLVEEDEDENEDGVVGGGRLGGGVAKECLERWCYRKWTDGLLEASIRNVASVVTVVGSVADRVSCVVAFGWVMAVAEMEQRAESGVVFYKSERMSLWKI